VARTGLRTASSVRTKIWPRLSSTLGPSASDHAAAADSGRAMGEGVVFSINESVDREVGRGHMSRWVGTVVHVPVPCRGWLS
jgi:hypothetical protein